MSYDISIADEEFNYTYNVSGMWYDCFPEKGIREFYGMTGGESIPVLRKLRDHMEDNRDRLIEMEPDNGWGSFEGALGFVNRLIGAAFACPASTWEGD